MQKTRFQVFVEWLFDNLFDFVTILVAGFLVIRYQIHPPSEQDIPDIVTWILGVLGLIAVSGLWERNRRLQRIEKLSEEGRNLTLQYFTKSPHASDFFLLEPRLDAKEFSAANTIYLAGRVLTRTLSEILHVLEKRLRAGATLRVIVLDPEKEDVLQHLSSRSIDASPEFWLNGIRSTEQILQMLAKNLSGKGGVEIGYLPYVPSFGLVLIDTEESGGFGFVEIYPHRFIGPHPVFRLQASEDAYWFNFFKEQYGIMWQSCRTETLG